MKFLAERWSPAFRLLPGELRWEYVNPHQTSLDSDASFSLVANGGRRNFDAMPQRGKTYQPRAERSDALG